MKNASTAEKKSIILVGAVILMTLKIMLGIVLIHRWRMQAARDGAPFVEDDDC